MLLPKTLLQQRYSLSVFTTTLLIALTTESSLAFSITTPTQYSPLEIYNTYNNNSSYVGTVTLYPGITSISRGGTTGFLQTLSQAFQGWTFNPAPSDLAGSFLVTEYVALAEPAYVGARLQLQYEPSNGDPTPANNSLHWIQRVWDNHSVATNVHGDNENVIDIGADVVTPFYDTPTLAEIMSGQILEEGTFSDTPKRPDRDQNHTWLAELYLVDHQPNSQNVTIYNGIQWGWSNTTQPVPEPLTIFASGVCLGFGALFKKTVKGTGQNKTKTLQKVKD